MRDAHNAQERVIRELLIPLTSRDDALYRPMAWALGVMNANIQRSGFREALAEYNAHDGRYARAMKWFVGFEGWNLLAILASLLGFACVSWLASHWRWFVGLLIVSSFGTVIVTGLALISSARRYAPWADRLADRFYEVVSWFRRSSSTS